LSNYDAGAPDPTYDLFRGWPKSSTTAACRPTEIIDTDTGIVACRTEIAPVAGNRYPGTAQFVLPEVTRYLSRLWIKKIHRAIRLPAYRG
jgi:hypothetical protein